MKAKIFPLVYTILLLIFITQVAPHKLIIDTDAGPDDAMAILLLLTASARNDSFYEIVAITCVHGVTEEKNVEQNVVKILTIANVTKIPVYAGAKNPLMKSAAIGKVFGRDGFGDFTFTDNINIKVNDSMNAADALVKLAKENKGRISILTLGPLTNIATAISLDPDFASNVFCFYIMGGSVMGMGNYGPGVDFNFGNDPDSAHLVLKSIGGIPALLYPWDCAHNTPIKMKWRKNILGSLSSKLMKFLNKAEKVTLDGNHKYWVPAETMLAAAMLWQLELITERYYAHVKVVNDGAGRGTLLVDHFHQLKKRSNAEIIKTIDIERFRDKLIAYFL